MKLQSIKNGNIRSIPSKYGIGRISCGVVFWYKFQKIFINTKYYWKDNLPW